MSDLSEEDLLALRSAVDALEHPGLAARLTDLIGKPIELLGSAMPASATNVITTAVSKALEMTLQVAKRPNHFTLSPNSPARILRPASLAPAE